MINETNTEAKTILLMEPSLHKFCFDLQEAVQNGFTIDPNLTPTMVGTYYECGLTKTASTAPIGPYTPPTIIINSSLASVAPNLSEALSGALEAIVPPKPRGRPAKGGK